MKLVNVAKLVLPAMMIVAGVSLVPSAAYSAGFSVASTDGIFQGRGRGGHDDADECVFDNRCFIDSQTFERGGHDDGPGHP